MNVESSVSIVIRLRAECLRNRSSILGGGKICLISKAFRSAQTYPASYSMDTGGFFREAMWLGREADHSYSSSTKFKWSHNVHFLTCHHGVHRITLRGQIQRLYHCFRSTNCNYFVA